MSNVKGYSSSGSEISTSFQNGVATFTSAPAKITYAYLAGYNSYGNRLGMTVTVSNLTFLLPRPSDYTILTDTPLPEGIVGRSYSATIQMWGYYADLKLDSNSSLPEGLSLSETSSTPGNLYLRTCQITGTPAKAGEYTFSTELWNAVGLASTRKDFKIKVVEKPTITTTSPLKEATVGAYYSMTFGATGTTPITWSKTSGTLPGGISFKASTKTLSGTPTKSGTFGFYIEAENEAGPTEKYFRLTVNPEPSITTTSLADATKGKYYSKTLSATGGTSPLTWSKTGGTATWATVSSSGVITGTPPEKGNYTLNVKVTDNNGVSVTQSFSIVITDVKPVIKTASLASGAVGMTYSTTLTATGTTPITWNVSGLPSGVTCSEAGVISGTPTTSGTFTITVTATNGAGSVGKQLTFTITEAETALTPTITVVSPTITTSALPSGKVGSVYSATLTATGTAPITWSASGLPSGVTCSEAGVISGTPRVSGAFTITITASNEAMNIDKQLSLTIAAMETIPTSVVVSPAITTTTLPSGKVSTMYSVTLTAMGTTPITWSVSGLPKDMVCSEAGVISGTPKSSGAFPISVTAKNNAGSDSKQLTLTIEAAGTTPSINPTPDNPTPDNPTPVTPDREADNIDTGLQEKIFKQLEPPSAAKKAMERRGLGTPNTLQKSNSNVGAERNVSSLQDEEKKIVSDNNATVAAVLPEMSVNVSGTYLLAVGIDANVPTGAALGLHLFQRTTSGKVAVSLSGEKDKATFFNDEGTEITTVPENHHVNVAVDLTAGVTYAPVITAVEASSTPDNGNDKDNTPDNKNDKDNTPDNGDGKNGNNTSGSGGGGGGGGCNTLSAGLALIALCGLVARKK